MIIIKLNKKLFDKYLKNKNKSGSKVNKKRW
jgi:hypothetical protein